MKKIAAVAVILWCFVCGLFAVGTVADDIAFLSPIVGSNPGVTIAGVQSGAAPWVVNHGFAVLNDEGHLRADLRQHKKENRSVAAWPVLFVRRTAGQLGRAGLRLQTSA